MPPFGESGRDSVSRGIVRGGESHILMLCLYVTMSRGDEQVKNVIQLQKRKGIDDGLSQRCCTVEYSKTKESPGIQCKAYEIQKDSRK